MRQEEYTLSSRNVAKQIGKSRKAAVQLMLNGELPAIRTGGVYRVRASDLAAYLEGARVVPVPPPAPVYDDARLFLRKGGSRANTTTT